MTLLAPRYATWLFYLFCLTICIDIACLPLFPSGDGSLHLYYSHVYEQIKDGRGTFPTFYGLRRSFGPYTLHYSVLAMLEHHLSDDAADKLCVLCILCNLFLGFRNLAKALGAHADVVCLLFFAIAIPWCLAAGFMNYTFSCGLALWNLGAWYRLQAQPLYTILFSISTALMVASHPLPLLVVAAILTSDCIQRYFTRVDHRHGRLFVQFQEGICLGIIFISVTLSISIADTHQVSHDMGRIALTRTIVRSFFSGSKLTIFKNLPWLAACPRLTAFMLLPISCGLAFPTFLMRLRSRTLGPADRLLATGVIMLAGTMVMPHEMNGSAYFSERLWWLIWLIILSSTSASMILSKCRSVLLCWSLVGMVPVLVGLLTVLPCVAVRAKRVDEAKLPLGKRGVLLVTPDARDQMNGLTYQTFVWQGARAFARNDAVLLNSPWLDLTILPVRSRDHSPLYVNHRPPLESLEPFDVPAYLLSQNKTGADLLGVADFVYLVGPLDKRYSLQDKLLRTLHQIPGRWACKSDSAYLLCEKSQATTH